MKTYRAQKFTHPQSSLMQQELIFLRWLLEVVRSQRSTDIPASCSISGLEETCIFFESLWNKMLSFMCLVTLHVDMMLDSESEAADVPGA